MRSQNQLLINQLDNKIKPFAKVKASQVPEKGWIHTIRTTLNMTLTQLGYKLKMTTQGAKDLEERESKGSVSIKTLKEVAKELDMRLVYAFVPNQDSIEKFVEMKAYELAKKIVLRTHQHMKLESQGNSETQINKAIKDLAAELKREMRKSLWD